ncbi:MAG: hypothetical protein U5O15_00645 [Candidatus Krumholzibacteriota bacterium]|nr:hypothetical protein [Candidatus Krumholzibacteriota bacterium]
MSTTIKIVAILLIIAGIIGLVYGRFVYARENHEANLGMLEISIQEKNAVNVPLWAGVAAVLAGGALLFVSYWKTWFCCFGT